jgi:hypothetical protein
MKYAVEMGLGALIYISSFIKIGLGIQKLMEGGGVHREHGGLISLILFFQSKESRLKTVKHGRNWTSDEQLP